MSSRSHTVRILVRRALLGAALCSTLWAAQALAQLREGIESWADATSGVTTARWAGSRVPFPTPEPRPEDTEALRSLQAPVSLHIPPTFVYERAHAALSALEDAHALLSEAGWDTRFADGEAGGDGSLDVYLVPWLSEGARAAVDASEPFRYLDTATSYGLADARVPDTHLAACVTSAYVQALLSYQDPAEAESVRRAAGAYVAFLVTGELGCDDSPLRPFREPWRTFMGQEPDAAGAGFLALFGSRQDRNVGKYVREVLQVARQRTWEGEGLRASPDSWEALNTVLDVHREELAEVADELAVARYLHGPQLVPGAEPPPLAGHYEWQELPVRTRPTEPALETLGSAYYLVDTQGAPKDAAMRVWLRGEYGVHWALSVVRLDAEGRDLGRVSAPARDYPRSYLALTLTPETAQVLIVVTNLSSRLPDADAPDENVRAAHLVIDQGER